MLTIDRLSIKIVRTLLYVCMILSIIIALCFVPLCSCTGISDTGNTEGINTIGADDTYTLAVLTKNVNNVYVDTGTYGVSYCKLNKEADTFRLSSGVKYYYWSKNGQTFYNWLTLDEDMELIIE